MRNKIVTTFFCLLLVGAAALSLALPDRYYSESEKRLLTQREELKLEEYGSGKFQSTLDQYLTDQFPGRNGWISLKTLGRPCRAASGRWAACSLPGTAT